MIFIFMYKYISIKKIVIYIHIINSILSKEGQMKEEKKRRVKVLNFCIYIYVLIKKEQKILFFDFFYYRKGMNTNNVHIQSNILIWLKEKKFFFEMSNHILTL